MSIDHLGNRRIRAVGELLANQVRLGLSRMERNVRERMSVQDNEVLTPQQIINIRPVTARDQRILWFFTIVSVHGPTQPAFLSCPHKTSFVCLRAWWFDT